MQELTLLEWSAIALCVFCILCFLGYQKQEEVKEKRNALEQDRFLEIQMFITRANGENMKRAANHVSRYISQYGQTPNATRLQMQLQRKQLGIPEQQTHFN